MPMGLYEENLAGYNSPLVKSYPGQTVAGLTPNQQQGYSDAIYGAGAGVDQSFNNADMYGNRLSEYQMNSGVDPNMASAINNIGGSFDPFANPALEDAISAMYSSSNRDFDRKVAPFIEDNAQAAGQRGSSRHAISDAIQRSDHSQQLMEADANMRSQGYEAGLNRYVNDRANTLNALDQTTARGTGIYDDYADASMAPYDQYNKYAGAQVNYGNAQQGINQGNMSAQEQNYYQDMNAPIDRLSWYNNVMSGVPGAGLYNTNQTSGGNTTGFTNNNTGKTENMNQTSNTNTTANTNNTSNQSDNGTTNTQAPNTHWGNAVTGMTDSYFQQPTPPPAPPQPYNQYTTNNYQYAP